MADSMPAAGVARLPQGRGASTGSARFAWGAAAFFGVASVLMTWPLAADLTAHYTSRQDFYLNLWILDWVARWLTEPGLELFRTEALYHPLGTSLASQDLTLVQTLAAAPLTLAYGPVVAFNALVLCSFWLAGVAAALWIRALTGDAAAGLLGGAIYSFAPYHLLYIPQLGMAAIGFLPLFLLADLDFTRAPGLRRAAQAGLMLAVVGLGAWYYGVCAGLVALVTSGARVLRAGPAGRARAVRLEGCFWLTCGVVLAPVVLQMLPAFLDQPALEGGEERAGIAWIMHDFKGTSSTVALWSLLGFVPLGLALLGVRAGRATAGLLLMTLGFLVLSLGESVSVGAIRIPLPYAWLQALPAVGAVRYPDRFLLVTQLGVAALAGFGLLTLRRRWSPPPHVVGALVLLPLLEFWPGTLSGVHPVEPPSLPAASDATPDGASPAEADAVLYLPTLFTHMDGEQMALATRHHRPVVGGYLMRRDPDSVRALLREPGLASLLGAPARLPEGLAAELAAAGVGYVCVQRAAWVGGAREAPQDILGVFSLGAGPFLSQRLFPDYARQAALPGLAVQWEQALTARLGPPITATEHLALYAVPPH
jgi:hypothetical protein